MPTGFWPSGPTMPSVGSIVSLSIFTDSTAPSVARMPQEISPPSNAGPAEQAQDIMKSRLPKTNSPFVPRSMKSENSSLSQIRLVNAPAVISPPTYEPMFGASKISASGLAGKPRSLAVMPRHWKNVGIYGSMRTGFASTPRSRWFIVVFDAMQTRNTRETEMPADLHIAATSGSSVSFKIASCSRFVPPGLPCSTMRLMTSAP